ncbi:hypothetical protein BGZ47_003171 [Haplosporangium gracile]|nr:hypothetical protein BGZ47_003171 [Haplosporangium gracile]
MRFIYCLAIAVALVATAAFAAPVIESTETLTATLDEGHLAKRGFRCDDPPECTSFTHYPDPKKRGLTTEVMEKRFLAGPYIRKASPKKAEAAENTRGHRYDNASDREGHIDIQLSRRAWHGPGSAACIDKSRGCYSEE